MSPVDHLVKATIWTGAALAALHYGDTSAVSIFAGLALSDLISAAYRWRVPS